MSYTGYQKSDNFCLKQGQGLRGRASPPHPRVYRVPPPPLAVLACYLPFGIIAALMAVGGLPPSLLVAWTYSLTILLFYSTLNPILYCWKIREVR